jgi:hypothetical protein
MLGQRLDGAGPVGVTLVGPAHTSAASAERVVRSPGNDVWLLGRCLVDGARDLPNAYAFQDSMKLLPLGPSVPMRVVPTQSQDPENFLAVSTSSWPATRRQRPRRHCLSVGPSSDCARGRSKSGPNLLIRFAQHGPRAHCACPLGAASSGDKDPPRRPGLENERTRHWRDVRADAGWQDVLRREPASALLHRRSHAGVDPPMARWIFGCSMRLRATMLCVRTGCRRLRALSSSSFAPTCRGANCAKAALSYPS